MKNPHGNAGNQNARKLPSNRKPRKKFISVSFQTEDAALWSLRAKQAGISLPAWIRAAVEKFLEAKR